MVRRCKRELLIVRAVVVAAILISLVPVRPADGQVASCFATPTPPPATDLGVGSQPAFVAIGDLNRDGLPDLAIANQGGSPGSVSIRLGRANGTFDTAPNVTVGAAPRSVAIGDFNGDGKPDLAVGNSSSNPSIVSIRLGRGDGTFDSAPDVPATGGPIAMAVADFDGNGNLDLAIAKIGGGGSSVVSIRLGDGLGGFSGTTEVPVGSLPISVAVGDFNADGRPDLAVANFGSNTVSIRLGNVGGGFDPPPSGPADIAVGAGPQAVAVGDLNGDGKTDVVTANALAGTVSILPGVGDGTFGPPVSVTSGAVTISVALGDFNGDARLDLAIANATTPGSVSIRLANGDGTFADPGDVGVGNGPTWVAVGDLNGDLVPDLAVANIFSDSVSVRLGNGNGSFGSTADVNVGPLPLGLAVGDLNGDLKADLATANAGLGNVSIRLGNGNGTFANAANVSIGNNPQSVAIADLNGDGRLDLVVPYDGPDSLAIRLGGGDGTFTNGADVATGSGPVAIAIGDLNGDGRLDLAVVNRADDTVSIRLGVGNGTFTNAANVNVGHEPAWVAIGDLNGDGRPDLAVANSGPTANSVSIRLGAGNGTFPGGSEVAVGTSPFSIALGDFDGDGRLDFATANQGSGTVSIRLGVGNGTFTSPTPADVTVGSLASAVAIGDLNGDGKLDFAVSNQGAGSVSVRLGNGNGTFTSTADVTVGSSPFSLALAHLSTDGRLDLAVANRLSDTVSVRLNSCGQDLVPQPRVPAAQTVPEDSTLIFSPANRNAVTVTDDGRSATMHVTLTAASGTLTLGTTIGLRFEAGDGSADPSVSFSGTLAQVNAALTGLGFTPAAQYNGPAGLTVTVHDDGHAGGTDGPTSGVATVPITVTSVEDAPVAVDDAYTAVAGTALNVAAPGVLANDADVDSPPSSFTAAVVVTTTHGQVNLASNGGFTYTPNATFSGTDAFTYRTSDGIAQSQPATVSITVTAVTPSGSNIAPTAVNDSFSTAAQTTLTIPAPGLLANDTDPDSPSLSAARVSDPVNGTVTISQDGGFVYVPKPGFFGSDSFTYRASDGAGQSSIATVILTVTSTACTPRPNVQTSPVAGGGQLRVHVESTPKNTQQNNAMTQIQFGTPQNARVTQNGQPVPINEPILLPANTFAVDFTVERLIPGQPATVPFSVVDGCGEWKSFVGGGAAAGF